MTDDSRHYQSPDETLRAWAYTDHVLLERIVGVKCPGIDLTLPELGQIASVLVWWESVRRAWGVVASCPPPPDTVERVARVVRRSDRPNQSVEEMGAFLRSGEMTIEADRQRVIVRRGRSWLTFERDDRVFVEELLQAERIVAVRTRR